MLSVRAWLLALVLSLGSATTVETNSEGTTTPSVDPGDYRESRACIWKVCDTHRLCSAYVVDENLCDDVDCPSGQHCEMTIETGPLCIPCVVHSQCPSDPSLVCGSDGKTYMNECHMRQVSCETGKKLTVDRKGACGGQFNFLGVVSKYLHATCNQEPIKTYLDKCLDRLLL